MNEFSFVLRQAQTSHIPKFMYNQFRSFFLRKLLVLNSKRPSVIWPQRGKRPVEK